MPHISAGCSSQAFSSVLGTVVPLAAADLEQPYAYAYGGVRPQHPAAAHGLRSTSHLSGLHPDRVVERLQCGYTRRTLPS